MAPLTSIRRPTIPSQSLTFADTQNTAPVHEYRCLYTRDLYKKAKKWHDGSLRFHTFNQRVMVYDDTKNYIGDLHYRQEDVFGEGVEIQLDRGLLVEVGERLGETETDLAPILDRQRPEKPETSDKPRLHSRQQSQRPKSLLELLGPSQARHARARFAVQSPYDQRNHGHSHEPARPPTKKPRLSTGKENLPIQGNVQLQAAYMAREPPSPLRRHTRPSSPPQRLRPTLTPSMDAEEVLNISSDEDDKVPSPLVKPTEHTTSIKKQIALSEDCGIRQKPLPKSTVKQRKPKAQNQPLPVQVREVNAQPLTRAQLSPKSGNFDLRRNPAPSASTVAPLPQKHGRLLLGNSRPRPKLLCLLPVPNPLPVCRHPIDPVVAADQPVDTALSPISLSSSSTSAGQLSPSPTPEVLTPPVQDPNSPEKSPFVAKYQEPSPLFLPDENSPPISPSQVALPTQEDFELDVASSLCTPHEQHSVQCELVQPSNGGDVQNHDNIFTIAGFEVSQQAPSNVRLSLDSHGLEIEPPATETPSKNRTSEVTFGSDVQDMQSAVQMDDNTVPDACKPAGMPPHLAPCPKSTNLDVREQQTHDLDITGIPIPEKYSGIEDEQAKLGLASEGGPWTAEEAYLLFDWWPPGMSKPDFWSAPVPVQSRTMKAPLPVFSTRITTARQIFHDDMNS